MYTINETNTVAMVCRAEGVPTPRIEWKKTSNSKIVGYGEQLQIVNTSGSDDGTYTCTAINELGSDSREVTLNVQSKPVVLLNIEYSSSQRCRLHFKVSLWPTGFLWFLYLYQAEISIQEIVFIPATFSPRNKASKFCALAMPLKVGQVLGLSDR